MSQEQPENIPVIRKRVAIIRWTISIVLATLLAVLFLQLFFPGFHRSPQKRPPERNSSTTDNGQTKPIKPPDNNDDDPAIKPPDKGNTDNGIPREIIQQMCAAAYEGKLDEVKKLISTYPKLISSRDADQQATPLLWAIEKDHREIISFLLLHGADINAQGQQGVSSLHRAALLGNVKQAKYLLEHGAKVNIKDNTNATPLINASGKGHLETVRLLLAHHPDVNVQESQGKWSALHAAILNKHADIVKLLLANGADISAKNIFDMTPLQSAREIGDAKIVKLLLQAGARE